METAPRHSIPSALQEMIVVESEGTEEGERVEACGDGGDGPDVETAPRHSIPSALQEMIVVKLEGTEEGERVKECLVETLGLSSQYDPGVRCLLHIWQREYCDNQVKDLLEWAEVKALRSLENIIIEFRQNKHDTCMSFYG